MPFDFLSDEWVTEARRIRAEHKGVSTPNANPVRINLIVTEVPKSGQIDAHIDTSAGELDIERGHIEGTDLTVTLDYETAKALLVDGNPQAVMSAFMTGKIRVDGDMSKLLAMQGTAPLGETQELAARIREITN
jgi:putative sterol carrier protein